MTHDDSSDDDVDDLGEHVKQDDSGRLPGSAAQLCQQGDDRQRCCRVLYEPQH